jgi:hypothetical protein
MLPFATQDAKALTTAGGESSNAALITFAPSSPALAPVSGEELHMAPSQQACFSLPFGGTVTAIAFTAVNSAEIPEKCWPFVELFWAPPLSNTFSALPGTITEASYSSGDAAGTAAYGYRDGIQLPLAQGSRIAVCARVRSESATQKFSLAFSGGLAIQIGSMYYPPAPPKGEIEGGPDPIV